MTRIEPTAAPATAAPAGVDSRASTPTSAAQAFEAAFVSEMLKHSGVARAVALDSGFGGEAMASFLVEEFSRLIAERGGLGLAAMIEQRLEIRR